VRERRRSRKVLLPRAPAAEQQQMMVIEVVGAEVAVLVMSSRVLGRGLAVERPLLLLGGLHHRTGNNSRGSSSEGRVEEEAVHGEVHQQLLLLGHLVVYQQRQAMGTLAGRVHQLLLQLPAPNAKRMQTLWQLHGNDTWRARSSRQRGAHEYCSRWLVPSWCTWCSCHARPQ
jgi:hypothetical protein